MGKHYQEWQDDSQQKTEIHLHSQWLHDCKKHLGADQVLAWGSRGPDIMLRPTNAFIEIKPMERKGEVRKAYDQCFQPSRQEKYHLSRTKYIAVITCKKIRIYRQRRGKGFPGVDNADGVFCAYRDRFAVLHFFQSKGSATCMKWLHRMVKATHVLPAADKARRLPSPFIYANLPKLAK